MWGGTHSSAAQPLGRAHCPYRPCGNKENRDTPDLPVFSALSSRSSLSPFFVVEKCGLLWIGKADRPVPLRVKLIVSHRFKKGPLLRLRNEALASIRIFPHCHDTALLPQPHSRFSQRFSQRRVSCLLLYFGQRSEALVRKDDHHP